MKARVYGPFKAKHTDTRTEYNSLYTQAISCMAFFYTTGAKTAWTVNIFSREVSHL